MVLWTSYISQALSPKHELAGETTASVEGGRLRSNSSIKLMFITSETAAKAGIEVYPNPCVNELHVNVAGKNVFQISLFNAVGGLIYAGETNSKLIIDMSARDKGDYMIEVRNKTTGNGYMKRIVKE